MNTIINISFVFSTTYLYFKINKLTNKFRKINNKIKDIKNKFDEMNKINVIPFELENLKIEQLNNINLIDE